MDKNEFDGWKKVTAASETSWIQDAVTFFNRGEILLYKGGIDGVFVSVEKNGTASIGFYNGAFPHIGESVFRTVYSKNFESQREAIFTVCESFSGKGIEIGDPVDYFLGLRFGMMQPSRTD